MKRFILYTYKNKVEFDAIVKECEEKQKLIENFEFMKTITQLEANTDIVIDITSLLHLLINNKENVAPAIINLNYMDEKTKIIIDENLADNALEILKVIFYDKEPLYTSPIEKDLDLINKNIPLKRKILYYYENIEQLSKIIEYCGKKDILFVNFSKINNMNVELNNPKNRDKIVVIDITTVILASNENNQIIYMLEQVLGNINNYNIVIRFDMVTKTLERCVFLFEDKEKVTRLFKDIEYSEKTSTDSEKNDDEVIKVTNLESKKLLILEKNLKEKLFGHSYFKKTFLKKLTSFIRLNKLKRKKILSVFILGNSGLGKTEFAKIIKSNLKDETSFIKINFGNYSSQDALNSLIGSPSGYVGCESGELSTKLSRSKAGIILCDEFEKTTLSVFNFFLELLEDGCFTDSMSREYDLDGYIIVFTSNINEQEFYKKLPKEFQSRIDLVCEFINLSLQEKKEYAVKYINELIEALKKDDPDFKISVQEYNKIIDIDFEKLENIREINRIIDDKIMLNIEAHTNI